MPLAFACISCQIIWFIIYQIKTKFVEKVHFLQIFKKCIFTISIVPKSFYKIVFMIFYWKTILSKVYGQCVTGTNKKFSIKVRTKSFKRFDPNFLFNISQFSLNVFYTLKTKLYKVKPRKTTKYLKKVSSNTFQLKNL